MPTQLQRTAAARSRLIAAASELVAAHGSASTSVMQIGQRAGMSRGAVNFDFGSKVALLEAVLNDAVRRCEQTSTLPVDLKAFLDDCRESWFERPERTRLLAMLFVEALTTQNPVLKRPAAASSERSRHGIASDTTQPHLEHPLD